MQTDSDYIRAEQAKAWKQVWTRTVRCVSYALFTYLAYRFAVVPAMMHLGWPSYAFPLLPFLAGGVAFIAAHDSIRHWRIKGYVAIIGAAFARPIFKLDTAIPGALDLYQQATMLAIICAPLPLWGLGVAGWEATSAHEKARRALRSPYMPKHPGQI